MERKGKLFFHRIKRGLNIHSIANLRQSKVARERVYVYSSQAEGGSLNLMKIPLIFDPKASPECVENYLIKQQMHPNKAIKRAIVFNSEHTKYLVLSMFQNVYKTPEPTDTVEEAQAYHYELVGYPLP